MANESVVRRADEFGSFLNVLGVIVGVAGIGIGIWVAIKAHSAQGTYPDGSQSLGGATRGFSYGVALAIGIGGVVVGCLLGWAGYVIRTLSAIDTHLRESPRTVPVARPIPEQAFPPPLPDFGSTFANGRLGQPTNPSGFTDGRPLIRHSETLSWRTKPPDRTGELGGAPIL